MTTNATTWRVLKFGGSSVSSRKDWDNILQIVSRYLDKGEKITLIHSAFKNVTNQLELVATQAVSGQQQKLLDDLLNNHLALAQELGVDASDLQSLFEQLAAICKQVESKGELEAKERAAIVAFGELLSSTLGAEFLKSRLGATYKIVWKDARKILKAIDDDSLNSGERYLNAVCHPRPDEALSQELSQEADLILSQGFIASNHNHETVLLGREGSDTSAAYFSVLLNAQELQIWTDVSGLYSCDPNKVSTAKKIEHISYNEAFDMAVAGAKVLHPRCLSAAKPYNIPLTIRSTHQPQETGSKIGGDYQASKFVKAIAMKQRVPLITLLLGRRGQQAQSLQKVFTVINDFGLTSELLASTKETLVLAIDTDNSIYSEQVLNELSAKLAEVCHSVFLSHSTIMTLIGCPASQALWHLLQINAELPEQWLLLSHTSSDHHLSFLVNDEGAEKVLNLLHDNLIK